MIASSIITDYNYPTDPQANPAQVKVSYRMPNLKVTTVYDGSQVFNAGANHPLKEYTFPSFVVESHVYQLIEKLRAAVSGRSNAFWYLDPTDCTTTATVNVYKGSYTQGVYKTAHFNTTNAHAYKVYGIQVNRGWKIYYRLLGKFVKVSNPTGLPFPVSTGVSSNGNISGEWNSDLSYMYFDDLNISFDSQFYTPVRFAVDKLETRMIAAGRRDCRYEITNLKLLEIPLPSSQHNISGNQPFVENQFPRAVDKFNPVLERMAQGGS